MAAYKQSVLPMTGTNFKLQPEVKLVLFILSFFFFFNLSRAHLVAWMRTQRKADGNTICSLSDSRGSQNARLTASSHHKSLLTQLYLIA